jgi:imidazolonepropionase-like amidohydrolase
MIAVQTTSANQIPTEGNHYITAFVDVNVVPMDTPVVLEHQTVVVVNGLISEVSLSSITEVPNHAQIINGTGKFLIPGLADMHVHISNQDEFLLFIANGVTTVNNMFGYTECLAWRSDIERGDILGPTIYTSGPIIDGNPPFIEGSTVVETAAEAKRVVVAQKSAGYDFIKVYDFLTQDAYAAILLAAEENGIPVVGHVPDKVGLSGVLASGQKSIEHLRGYAPALASYPDKVTFGTEDWAMADTSKMHNLAEATRDAGVWNCPTLVVSQKWVQPDEQRELLAMPVMRYISPEVRAEWDPSNNYLSYFTAEKLAAVKGSHRQRSMMTRALHESGARLLLGTDSGNPFVVAGFSVHEELANLVDSGLTPYEALLTGTRNAAEFVDAPKKFGVVTTGARADLILTKHNPLDDIDAVAKSEGVMVRGVWLPRKELLQMLERLAESYTSVNK